MNIFILRVTVLGGHVSVCGEKLSSEGMHEVCSKTKSESEVQQFTEVSVTCFRPGFIVVPLQFTA